MRAAPALLTIVIAVFVACGTPEEGPVSGGDPVNPDAPVSSTPEPDGRSKEARYRRVVPIPGMADLHPIRWQSFEEVDARTLLVRFTSGVEPCYVLDHVEVEYGSEEVVITLFEGHDPDRDNVACIEIAESKQVKIELEEPVGTRKVVDGATSRARR